MNVPVNRNRHLGIQCVPRSAGRDQEFVLLRVWLALKAAPSETFPDDHVIVT